MFDLTYSSRLIFWRDRSSRPYQTSRCTKSAVLRSGHRGGRVVGDDVVRVREGRQRGGRRGGGRGQLQRAGLTAQRAARRGAALHLQGELRARQPGGGGWLVLV